MKRQVSQSRALSEDRPAPGLYLVSTPIGNLGDITLRALKTLKGCDLIACEDTRVTRKLLAHYGISARLLSYNDHNAAHRRPELLHRLEQGERVALVSDAGTPLIADPGYKLVREAQAGGIAVTIVPGPSSLLAALCLAGLPTDRFLFAGFLPAREAARDRALAELRDIPATLVFFESPQRLADTLAGLSAALGGREAAVARELTKRFEELRRAPLWELAAHYREAGAPKGEVVIVVAPPAAEQAMSEEAIDILLRSALSRGTVKDAVAEVALATGQPHRKIYGRALALKGER